MKILFVASRRDAASLNIAWHLSRILGLEPRGEAWDSSPVFGKGRFELVYVKRDIIFADGVTRPADIIVFLSRHRAEAGRRTLSAHPTGNFGGDADYGGRPGELGIAPAPLMWRFLRRLAQEGLGEYEVTYEVTHHGPTSYDKPLFFAEIGPGPLEWGDGRAGEAVARALAGMEWLMTGCRPAVAFGGPHYAPRFTRLALGGDVCPGHMLPKYRAGLLSKDVVEAMVRRTVPPPVVAIVEKKSFKSAHRRLLLGWLEDLGLETVVV